MSYQVYFGDLTEENQALVLTLLRLKDEAGQLEPEESELLVTLRGTAEPAPYPPPESPTPARRGRQTARRGTTRRNGTGRSSSNASSSTATGSSGSSSSSQTSES